MVCVYGPLTGPFRQRHSVRHEVHGSGVSGRGTKGINVIHPQFEAIWHESRSDVNVHVVWSPQILNSGAGGWQTHHQIALFADRALFVALFGDQNE